MVKGPDSKEWLKAINKEKNSLKENETWKLVPRRQDAGKGILNSTWILNEKEDGRKKARLVIRGDQQIPGIDFEETYSPVVSNNALRIILALAGDKAYNIMTFDVKTAFLYGQLDEENTCSYPRDMRKITNLYVNCKSLCMGYVKLRVNGT